MHDPIVVQYDNNILVARDIDPASCLEDPQATMPREMQLKAGITDDLVRISTGIEDAEDIIADLDRALNKV